MWAASRTTSRLNAASLHARFLQWPWHQTQALPAGRAGQDVVRAAVLTSAERGSSEPSPARTLSRPRPCAHWSCLKRSQAAAVHGRVQAPHPDGAHTCSDSHSSSAAKVATWRGTNTNLRPMKNWSRCGTPGWSWWVWRPPAHRDHTCPWPARHALLQHQAARAQEQD